MSAKICGRSRGFKPHVLEEVLGIKRDIRKYWQDKLDPTQLKKSEHRLFKTREICIYAVFQELTCQSGISVKKLSRANNSKLFRKILSVNIGVLKGMHVVYDRNFNRYEFYYSEEEIINIIRKRYAKMVRGTSLYAPVPVGKIFVNISDVLADYG